MRKLFLLFLLLSMGGCATTPLFYHSEASLLYSGRLTKSEMELLLDANNSNPLEFGVVHCKDNDDNSYLVISPLGKGAKSENLDGLILQESVTIKPEQLDQLIRIVEISSAKWEAETTGKHGMSYEYLLAPENRIIKETDHTETWYPSLKYYFQNIDNKSVVSIILGNPSTIYHYYFKIDDFSNLESFLFILKKGRDLISKK